MVHLARRWRAAYRLEHFALSASGLKDFLDRLNRGGERYEALRAPGNGVVQVNVWDPDGKHIRFPPENAVAVEFTEAARQSRRLKLAPTSDGARPTIATDARRTRAIAKPRKM